MIVKNNYQCLLAWFTFYQQLMNQIKNHQVHWWIFIGLSGENRTHNTDLGGPRYIHLTTERNIQFLRCIYTHI